MSAGMVLSRSVLIGLDDYMMTNRNYGSSIDFDQWLDKSIICDTYDSNTFNCPCPSKLGKFIMFKGYISLQVYIPRNRNYPIYLRIIMGNALDPWTTINREALTTESVSGGV